MLRKLSTQGLRNDVTLICLGLGIYWIFFETVNNSHLFFDRAYGWLHLLVGVLSCITLGLQSVRGWKLCLICAIVLYVDDATFYFIATGDRNRAMSLAVIFSVLAITCLLRLTGLYVPGNLVSDKTRNE